MRGVGPSASRSRCCPYRSVLLLLMLLMLMQLMLMLLLLLPLLMLLMLLQPALWGEGGGEGGMEGWMDGGAFMWLEVKMVNGCRRKMKAGQGESSPGNKKDKGRQTLQLFTCGPAELGAN